MLFVKIFASTPSESVSCLSGATILHISFLGCTEIHAEPFTGASIMFRAVLNLTLLSLEESANTTDGFPPKMLKMKYTLLTT